VQRAMDAAKEVEVKRKTLTGWYNREEEQEAAAEEGLAHAGGGGGGGISEYVEGRELESRAPGGGRDNRQPFVEAAGRAWVHAQSER
jgi:hypothetical protein